MPYWSCTLYQINPECNGELLKELLSASDEVYDFGSHDGELMSLYIDDQEENGYGTLVYSGLDIITKTKGTRRNPSRRVIVTQEVYYHMFDVPELEDLILVYASSNDASAFSKSVRPIYSSATAEDLTILYPTSYRIRQNYQYLIQRFPNLAGFSADQIRTNHVTKGRVKGREMQDSPEFQEWVLDANRRGSLTSIVLNVDGYEITVKPDGSMHSAQGRRPVAPVISVLQALLGCNAIIRETDYTSVFS